MRSVQIDGSEFAARRKEFEKKAKQFVDMSVFLPAGFFGFTEGLVFPDKDISTLGIGAHRFFFFHSAIGLYVLEKAYLKYVGALNDKNNGLSRRIFRKISGALLGSAAFGVGIHLLTDVFEPKSVVFPFFGSLADGTLVDDRLWLLGNSLWCFQIARNMFVLSFGGNKYESIKVTCRGGKFSARTYNCKVQNEKTQGGLTPFKRIKKGVNTMDERTKKSLKSGLAGLLIGSVIEEVIEAVIPGGAEFGALGEILGAIAGVAIANQDEVLGSLEDLKRATGAVNVKDALGHEEFTNWKQNNPDIMEKIERGLSLT